MKVQELFTGLHVKEGDKAIEFYKAVFGATECFRLVEPGGRLGHCELEIGGHTIMISEESPELGIVAPKEGAGWSMTLHVHVDNADDVVKHAVELGAVIVHPLQDHFYGERSGSIRDPFGHRWNIGHHIEEVSPDEMQRRYDKGGT